MQREERARKNRLQLKACDKNGHVSKEGFQGGKRGRAVLREGNDREIETGVYVSQERVVLSQCPFPCASKVSLHVSATVSLLSLRTTHTTPTPLNSSVCAAITTDLQSFRAAGVLRGRVTARILKAGPSTSPQKLLFAQLDIFRCRFQRRQNQGCVGWFTFLQRPAGLSVARFTAVPQW